MSSTRLPRVGEQGDGLLHVIMRQLDPRPCLILTDGIQRQMNKFGELFTNNELNSLPITA